MSAVTLTLLSIDFLPFPNSRTYLLCVWRYWGVKAFWKGSSWLSLFSVSAVLSRWMRNTTLSPQPLGFKVEVLPTTLLKNAPKRTVNGAGHQLLSILFLGFPELLKYTAWQNTFSIYCISKDLKIRKTCMRRCYIVYLQQIGRKIKALMTSCWQNFLKHQEWRRDEKWKCNRCDCLHWKCK